MSVFDEVKKDYDELLTEEAVDTLVKRWRTYIKYQAVDLWTENMYAFLDFAVDNGYRVGLKICRQNAVKPFGPDNCYFAEHTNSPAPVKKPDEQERETWEQQWDRCVYEFNRERVAEYRKRHG